MSDESLSLEVLDDGLDLTELEEFYDTEYSVQSRPDEVNCDGSNCCSNCSEIL